MAIDKARFRRPIVPGDALRIEVTMLNPPRARGARAGPSAGGRPTGFRSRIDVHVYHGKGGGMTQIHPTAVIEAGAELDAGVEVGAYAIVSKLPCAAGRADARHAACFPGRAYDDRPGLRHLPVPLAHRLADAGPEIPGRKTFVEIGARARRCGNTSPSTPHQRGRRDAVGEGCHIMAYSHVAHQCTVGNGVIIPMPAPWPAM